MVTLNTFKAFAMTSIFAIAMLGGFAPFMVARRRWHARQQSRQQESDDEEACAVSVQQPTDRKACSPERVLSVLNMASAGVFLSAGLLHLLADAISNEELSDLSERFWGEEGGSRHAIALCLAGLLFLIGVEQIGHAQFKQPGEGCCCCSDAEDPGREAAEPLCSSATSSESDNQSLEAPQEQANAREQAIGAPVQSSAAVP